MLTDLQKSRLAASDDVALIRANFAGCVEAARGQPLSKSPQVSPADLAALKKEFTDMVVPQIVSAVCNDLETEDSAMLLAGILERRGFL